MMYPRSLRPHIEVCRTLPLDVRKRQAEQRTTYFGRKHKVQLSTVAPAASSSTAVPASSSTAPASMPTRRCRIFSKRPAPAAYKESKPAVGKTVAPCGDWQLAYLHSVRERYMQKNPRRQMTSTDLPNFPIPKGWTNALKCWFCKEDQDCSEARNKHVRSCPQMPYNLWLRRLRVIQFAAKDSPFTCPHCGTPMFTAKAKGKHSTACATRRMNFQLPLGQETYIPDSELERPNSFGPA